MAVDRPILVVGGTGKQGGAVARALEGAGVPIRALVRNPQSDGARRLADLGADLVQGDLDDPTSIEAAATGARAVFSMQVPDLADIMGDSEVRYGRNLVEASRAAGVEQIVHSSVAGSGSIDPSTIDEHRWGAYVGHYWRSKLGVEKLVRDAGFDQWTILRPASFMENLVRPSFYFADLTSDRLLIAIDPDEPVPFVAVEDIGIAAAAAFTGPARFDGMELELVGEVLSYRKVAEILSGVLGTTIVPPSGPDQARADGLFPQMADAQEFSQWNRREHPQGTGPNTSESMGISMTSFRHWVAKTFV
jgi:uncharacterized protein YbjT (DUF2867 family)